MRKTLLYPNISETKRCQANGLRELLSRDWSNCRWLEGHVPYGVHRLMKGWSSSPVYFTMLRRPIKQAISYYYFVLHSKSSSYEHPHYRDAAENSLTEFYKIPRHQNLQTRYLAGYLCNRVRNWCGFSIYDSLLLRLAKKHLIHQYISYGLVERFEASLELIASHFGWEYEIPQKRIKSNPFKHRPHPEDLSRGQRVSLQASLDADCKLYAFAKDSFNQQLRG